MEIPCRDYFLYDQLTKGGIDYRSIVKDVPLSLPPSLHGV